MPTAITSGTSPDTPPLHRKSSLLKRHSRPSINSHSHSHSNSPANSPLQPSPRINVPNMPVNDDAAEKASRRKSAHFADLSKGGGVPPPQARAAAGSGGVTGENNGKRTVSALAMQAQAGAQKDAHNQRRAKRLSAVAPAAPPVSMEVMNTNFEEWMKLATDNKITATNTWNFALIDYFADLTLLRNGPDDQSINFQKASCTLDGCVKIWTSRVDSVATETGKLLSGLAGGGGPEDEGVDGEAGEDEEGGEPKATRKTHRSEATLAKSFAALQIKKFDLEATVDPLFKKTSADFDEGGAMGLLMNHLGVDGQGRVVFDAGDAGLDQDNEDIEVEDELIDLTRLRQFIPSVERASELNISDTLSSFRFSSDPDATPDFSTLLGLKDSWDDEPRPSYDAGGEYDDGMPAAPGEVQDFFGDEDFDMGPSMPGGFDDGASMAGDGDEDGDVFGASATSGRPVGMVGPGETHGPFDPRRQGGELVMALAGDDDDGMFDYFDRGLGKAWAGAEHWKLRKVSRKDVATPAGAAAAAGSKPAKSAKAPFTIDFTAPSTEATSSKTLFAPASRGTISFAASSKGSSARRSSSKKASTGGDASKKRKDEWLLPDDMHFSSRQLLRLFLKPKFALRMRRNATSPRMAEKLNGEIDENFWAQAAADRADLADPDGMDNGDMPVPFESQFFNDPDDDGGDYAFVDDALDETPAPDHEEHDDLWQGTQGQQLKRARPENVNFAKKAKRVDVKRLKDDIWSGLRGLVPDEGEGEVGGADKDGGNDTDTSDPLPTTPKATDEVKTFSNIITSLRSSYPQDKMAEISTSFCFICLLHLANEEGLRIETARFDGKEGEDVGCMGTIEDGEAEEEGEGDDKPVSSAQTPGPKRRRRMDEGERRDRVVGELQALRVYKDPNAGRAA